MKCTIFQWKVEDHIESTSCAHISSNRVNTQANIKAFKLFNKLTTVVCFVHELRVAKV